jgi:pentafunctional AROM polypeptide
METLGTICVGSHYDVVVAAGALAEAFPRRIVALVPAARYIVVTDSNVGPLYAATVVEALRRIGPVGAVVLSYTVCAGEASKTRETKAVLEDWLLSHQCGRDTCLVALGGGVVGDLTGFVAATFVRGIPYVQVPTSLLAMVDSAIGGKTGVDTPAGKNMVGAFYQPRAVLIDVDVLQTLPPRELRNGMAEVIKAGAIADADLFTYLETHVEAVLALDRAVLLHVLHRSVAIKADVVVRDEREGGLRSILNFGHSIGHAIEAELLPTWLHGECVSVGMVLEAQLARGQLNLDTSHIHRLHSCLQAYELPIALPLGLSIPALLDRMAIDKKNMHGHKHVVMLRAIGCVWSQPYTRAVTDDALRLLFEAAVCIQPPDLQPAVEPKERVPATEVVVMASSTGPAPGNIMVGAVRTITVPGSKSVSNRAVLLAALGHGPCRLHGLLHSEDTQVMLAAVRTLGVGVAWEDDGRVLVVHGRGGRLRVPTTAAATTPTTELYLANAGTALRFLTSACLLLPDGDSVVLTGSTRMKERPIGVFAGAQCIVIWWSRSGIFTLFALILPIHSCICA